MKNADDTQKQDFMKTNYSPASNFCKEPNIELLLCSTKKISTQTNERKHNFCNLIITLNSRIEFYKTKIRKRKIGKYRIFLLQKSTHHDFVRDQAPTLIYFQPYPASPFHSKNLHLQETTFMRYGFFRLFLIECFFYILDNTKYIVHLISYLPTYKKKVFIK